MLRGGSWCDYSKSLRSAVRFCGTGSSFAQYLRSVYRNLNIFPGYRGGNIGFRVARTV